MSRYIKSIEVKSPNALTANIAGFLQDNGFVPDKRDGKPAWTRSGFNCRHYIITEFKSNAIVITAFITYKYMMLGSIFEREASFKGIVAIFGKLPLKKTVRALEQMLFANKDLVQEQVSPEGENAYDIGNAETEGAMQSLANYAFDKLLTRGIDYTVVGEVKGAILVKKDVKWAYFQKNGDAINALFIITTDISTFAFQAREGKLFLIPTDLVMSMYEFK